MSTPEGKVDISRVTAAYCAAVHRETPKFRGSRQFACLHSGGECEHFAVHSGLVVSKSLANPSTSKFTAACCEHFTVPSSLLVSKSAAHANILQFTAVYCAAVHRGTRTFRSSRHSARQQVSRKLEHFKDPTFGGNRQHSAIPGSQLVSALAENANISQLAAACLLAIYRKREHSTVRGSILRSSSAGNADTSHFAAVCSSAI